MSFVEVRSGTWHTKAFIKFDFKTVVDFNFSNIKPLQSFHTFFSIFLSECSKILCNKIKSFWKNEYKITRLMKTTWPSFQDRLRMCLVRIETWTFVIKLSRHFFFFLKHITLAFKLFLKDSFITFRVLLIPCSAKKLHII